MKKSKALLLTSMLVILVGGPAVYSVVKIPEPVVTDFEVSGSARTPASVSQLGIELSAGETRNALKAKSVTMDLACDKEKTIETDGSHVRLKSLACKTGGNQNVSIVNQANGYTASVIFTKNRQFTTDYIELNDGDNKIEIQSENSNGEKLVQHLILKRRAPASEPATTN